MSDKKELKVSITLNQFNAEDSEIHSQLLLKNEENTKLCLRFECTNINAYINENEDPIEKKGLILNPNEIKIMYLSFYDSTVNNKVLTLYDDDKNKSIAYSFNFSQGKWDVIKINKKSNDLYLDKIKEEFDKDNRIKGALYPYYDKKAQDYEPQWTKLKAALSDDHITNIAIMSSYDTGKTSFLESFFSNPFNYQKNNKKDNKIINWLLGKPSSKAKKYKFITVANFDNKDEKEQEINLEREIINQLLFSENPLKYPDSRIDRIHSFSNGFIFLIWMIFWILFGLISSLTSFWQNNFIRKGFIVGIFVVISWFIIFYLVHSFYTLSWKAKANLGLMELSTSKDKDDNSKIEKNLFILYGDEIKYYFKKSGIRYLVLEDMDRFKNIEIFQKLRELNRNINESEILKSKVVFIYTLSDEIFEKQDYLEVKPCELINENKGAEDKSKFFDYIISMVPFNNSNSSRKLFINELNKYPELPSAKISNSILLGISMYISDKREITCIVADMDTYLRSLNNKQADVESRIKNDPNFYNKLLGAMIYKNVYFDDFDNIIKGKSRLAYLMHRKNELRDLVNNLISDKKIESNAESVKKYINMPTLSNLLSVIFNNYDEVSDSGIEAKLQDVLDFINNTNILRYLLIHNLLEGDIYEYISPTEFDSLSSSDEIQFIQEVLDQRMPKVDFKIDDEKELSKIIDFLDGSDANYNYIYSSSILKRLIETGEKSKVDEIIAGLCEKETINKADKYSFVNEIIKWIKTKDNLKDSNYILLNQAICKSWMDYYEEIVNDENYELYGKEAIKYVLKETVK